MQSRQSEPQIKNRRERLHRFAGRHPGGKLAIQSLYPEDLAIYRYLIHGRDKKAQRMLDADTSHGVQLQSAQSLDRLWLVLVERLNKAGLFERTVSAALLHYLVPIIMFWLCVLLLQSNHGFLAGLFAFVACLKTIHFTHDLGHNAIFSSGRLNRIVNRWIGIILLGMDTRVFSANHMFHHAFTNVLDQDEALNNGSIKFHPQQGQPPKAQAFIWLMFIAGSGVYFWASQFIRLIPAAVIRRLPFAFKNWRRGSAVQLDVLMGPWECLLVLVRMVVWIAVFGFWLTVIPMLLGIVVTAYLATLNHLHLPISTQRPRTAIVARQAAVTQNWYGNPRALWTWVSGGLNLHLCHHLFPSLPAFRLARADRIVRRFCDNRGLPYHEVSLPKAMRSAWLKSADPFNVRFVEGRGEVPT